MRKDCLYQYPMITECVHQGRADPLGIVYVSRESLQDKKSNKRRRPTKFARPESENYQQGCHPNPKMKRPKAGQLVNYGLEFQLLIPVKKTELSAMERPRKTVRNSTFYSPQLFEANLKTALFFFLLSFFVRRFVKIKDIFFLQVQKVSICSQ